MFQSTHTHSRLKCCTRIAAAVGLHGMGLQWSRPLRSHTAVVVTQDNITGTGKQMFENINANAVCKQKRRNIARNIRTDFLPIKV